jgi:MoaA/NifB/PqqE/SkfB family radical SAM enzyme
MNRWRALFYLPWLEGRRRVFQILHSAEVDVTDNCNLRCRHCYHFQGKDEFEKQECSLSEWEHRFRSLYQQGVRLILLVGGEPALRIDVLMLAHGIFPFIFVITNGTILIPKAFAHRLFVSLDGDRKVNDRIRGRGVFDRVIANYHGDDRVVVNMVMTRHNYLETEALVGIAREHGFRGVVCNFYTPSMGTDDPLVLDPATRKKVVAELRRVKKLYPADLLLSEAMLDWYAQPDHRGFCYWGDQALHFDVSWKKRRCFSDKADCSNCGCLAGSFGSPLNMLKQPGEMRSLIYEVGDPKGPFTPTWGSFARHCLGRLLLPRR